MVYQYIYFCLSESPRCPVRSLVAYIKKLNPRCKSFFQQSRKDTKDGIYYNNVALGTGESSSFVVYGTCPPYMKLLIAI
jgi:hypothetical protein